MSIERNIASAENRLKEMFDSGFALTTGEITKIYTGSEVPRRYAGVYAAMPEQRLEMDMRRMQVGKQTLYWTPQTDPLDYQDLEFRLEQFGHFSSLPEPATPACSNGRK